MKIRCEQDSLRLRLRKSELVQLRAEKAVETRMGLPGGHAFSWELMLDENLDSVQVAYADAHVRVELPYSVALHWMDTHEVGMEYFLPLENGGKLHLLIEKDFPCKDRPEEDRTDFFGELAEQQSPIC